MNSASNFASIPDCEPDLPPDRFGAHPGLAFDATGAPYDRLYGDRFHSCAGAWQQAHSVFLAGCRVPERWRGRERFTVLELGFGLGVNFLATLAAWRADPARSRSLHFVSVEGHPLTSEDLARGLHALEARGSAAAGLLRQWPLALPGLHRLCFEGGAVTLTLAFGDASRMVPRLALAADAFYLDGFAPVRNPAMWQPALLRALARHARRGARLASWTAAGEVRRALAAAGFEVFRVAGFGGKRHRTEAVWAPRWRTWSAPAEPPALPERRVLVIGAGLAGAAVAHGFARRGFEVEVLDDGAAPGGQGSSQPLCAEHPHLSPDDNPLARLSRAALLLSGPAREGARAHGRIELAADDAGLERQAALLARLGFPQGFVTFLARHEASEVAGIRLPRGGLWLPDCAALSPREAIAGWLSSGDAPARSSIRFRGSVTVARVAREPNDDGAGWTAFDPGGRTLASAPIAVLANAGGAVRLGNLASLAVRRVRGQTSWLRDPALAGLRVVLGGPGYAAPAGDVERHLLIGASFSESEALAPDPRDDLGNLRRLGRMLACDIEAMRASVTPAATGFRFVLRDRLPAIGVLPDEAAAGLLAGDLNRNARVPIPLADGLYGAFGFGSRGLLWASLAAEVLPAMVCGEPAPIESDLLGAIAPARFLRRRLRWSMRLSEPDQGVSQ